MSVLAVLHTITNVLLLHDTLSIQAQLNIEPCSHDGTTGKHATKSVSVHPRDWWFALNVGVPPKA